MHRHTRSRMTGAARWPLWLALLLALCACRREPPPTEVPPEPQAAQATTAAG